MMMMMMTFSSNHDSVSLGFQDNDNAIVSPVVPFITDHFSSPGKAYHFSVFVRACVCQFTCLLN